MRNEESQINFDQAVNRPVQYLNNGSADHSVSSSRYSCLLASRDRDFLLSPTGTQVKVSELEGKVVGLYFSANWYRPCRNFNQVLDAAYQDLKNRGAGFEIVFVSSDENLVAFNNYHASMPWLAVPYSDLETRKALNQKYDVEGIPYLVVLQPDDEENAATLADGVDLIYRYGIKAFPFTREKLEELKKEEREKHESQTLTNLLTNHDREYLLAHTSSAQTPVSSLVGKTVGLFFSAKWCNPCARFLPKLIAAYEKIKQSLAGKENEDFEIIFVSSDCDQNSFNSYFSTMPWLAIPYGDPTIKNLAKYFDVQGIPCLVIIGPDGKTVTKQAASAGGGGTDHCTEVNRESIGVSAGLIGPSELVWGRGGIRSHTRYGSLNGGNGKNIRNSRISKMVDHLRHLEGKDAQLDVHLLLVSFDEQIIPRLQKPCLCCKPTLLVRHLCEYVAQETAVQGNEIVIYSIKELQSEFDFFTSTNSQSSKSTMFDPSNLQVVDEQEMLAGLTTQNFTRGQLLLVYKKLHRTESGEKEDTDL